MTSLARRRTALLLVTTLAGAAAASCGGSVSETPWPAEPIDLEPGPAGEERARGNVIDTKKLPDNYTKQQEERAKENTKDPSAPTDDPEPVDENDPLDEDESNEDDTSGEDE